MWFRLVFYVIVVVIYLMLGMFEVYCVFFEVFGFDVDVL